MPAAQHVFVAEQTLLTGSPFNSVSSLLRYERRRGLSGRHRSSEVDVGPVRPYTALGPQKSCRGSRSPLTAIVPPGEEHSDRTTRTSYRRSLHETRRRDFLRGLFDTLKTEPEWKRRQHLDKDQHRPREPREWDDVIAKAFEYSRLPGLTGDQVIDNIRYVDSHCGWTNNPTWIGEVHRRLSTKYPQELVKQSGGSVAVYLPLLDPSSRTAQLQSTKARGAVAGKTRSVVGIKALPVSRKPAAVRKADNVTTPTKADQDSDAAQQAQKGQDPEAERSIADIAKQQSMQLEEQREQYARLEMLRKMHQQEHMRRFAAEARAAELREQLTKMKGRHDDFMERQERLVRKLDTMAKPVVTWYSRKTTFMSNERWEFDLRGSLPLPLRVFLTEYCLLARAMQPIMNLASRYDRLIDNIHTGVVSPIIEILRERHSRKLKLQRDYHNRKIKDLESKESELETMRTEIDWARNHWEEAIADGARFHEDLTKNRIRFCQDLKSDMMRAIEWEVRFKVSEDSLSVRSILTWQKAIEGLETYCENMEQFDFWNDGSPLFPGLNLKWTQGTSRGISRRWSNLEDNASTSPSRRPLSLICIFIDLKANMGLIGTLLHEARAWVKIRRDMSRSHTHQILFASYARRQRLETIMDDYKWAIREMTHIARNVRLHMLGFQARRNRWVEINNFIGALLPARQRLGRVLSAITAGYGFPQHDVETYLARVVRPLYLATVNVQSLRLQISQLRRAIMGLGFPEDWGPNNQREIYHAYSVSAMVLGTCWFLRDALGLGQRKLPDRPMPVTREVVDEFFGHKLETRVTCSTQVSNRLDWPRALQLYPLGQRAIPIHYVFKPQSLDQALAEFGQPDVLGIDMTWGEPGRRGDAARFKFISIASEERVLVLNAVGIHQFRIEDVAVRCNRLIDIVCNPKISKVGVNVARLRRELEMVFSCETQGFHNLDLDNSGPEKARLKHATTLAAVKVLETPLDPQAWTRPSEFLKLLARRPLALVHLFREWSGDVTDSPTGDLGGVPVALGPVHFERSPTFLASPMSGLNFPGLKQRRDDSLLLLASDLASGVYLDRLSSSHGKATMETPKLHMAGKSNALRRTLWKLASFQPWAAYYLATTFREPVHDIGQWLQLESPARCILRLVDAVGLPLRPEHRLEFEHASKYEPQLAEIQKGGRKRRSDRGSIHLPTVVTTRESLVNKRQTKQEEQKERRKQISKQMLKSKVERESVENTAAPHTQATDEALPPDTGTRLQEEKARQDLIEAAGTAQHTAGQQASLLDAEPYSGLSEEHESGHSIAEAAEAGGRVSVTGKKKKKKEKKGDGPGASLSKLPSVKQPLSSPQGNVPVKARLVGTTRTNVVRVVSAEPARDNQVKARLVPVKAPIKARHVRVHLFNTPRARRSIRSTRATASKTGTVVRVVKTKSAEDKTRR